MRYKITISTLAAGLTLLSGASIGMATESQSQSDRAKVEEECADVGVSLDKREPALESEQMSKADMLKAELARREALEKERKERLCQDNKHGTPLFLREDLAYSVTGVDCFGDAPSDYSTNDGKAPIEKSRAPASIKTVEPGGTEYEPVQ